MDNNNKYSVICDGEIEEGRDVEDVKTQLALLFKTDISKIGDIFIGSAKIIKNNVDYETAEKYRKAFKKAGAICRIEAIRPDKTKLSEQKHTEKTENQNDLNHQQQTPIKKLKQNFFVGKRKKIALAFCFVFVIVLISFTFLTRKSVESTSINPFSSPSSSINNEKFSKTENANNTNKNIKDNKEKDINRMELVIQKGHQSPISKINFSPDGQLLISESDDKMVIIWDIRTGLEIYSNELSKIGEEYRYILKEKSEKNILNNKDFDELSNSFIQNDKNIYLTAYNPDKKIIATASGGYKRYAQKHMKNVIDQIKKDSANKTSVTKKDGNSEIILWEISTKEKILSLNTDLNFINSILFSDNSKYLIAISMETICVWDIPNKKEVYKGKYIGFHPKSMIIITKEDKLLSGFNIISEKFQWKIKYEEAHHSDSLNSQFDHLFINTLVKDNQNSSSIAPASFSLDGSLYAIGDLDGNIIILDSYSGKEIRKLSRRSAGAVTNIYVGDKIIWEHIICYDDFIS